MVKPSVFVRYRALVNHLHQANPFEPLYLDEFTPSDTRERQYHIDNIGDGLPSKCVLFKVVHGNNLGTRHFLWHVPNGHSEEMILKESSSFISKIKKNMPTYHTRAMRRTLVQTKNKPYHECEKCACKRYISHANWR